MKHTLLKKADKKINKLFITEWLTDEILLVRYGKDDSPFAQLLYQEESGEQILLSVAVDCTDPQALAKLILDTMTTVPLILAEPFFIQADGSILYGNKAYEEHDAEKSSFCYFKINNSNTTH